MERNKTNDAPQGVNELDLVTNTVQALQDKLPSGLQDYVKIEEVIENANGENILAEAKVWLKKAGAAQAEWESCVIRLKGALLHIAVSQSGVLTQLNATGAAAAKKGSAAEAAFSTEIAEVRFSGAKYHQLKSDNGQTIYSAPHWVDLNGDGHAKTNTATGERNYPVAFTRNTKPQIEAKFKTTKLPSGQTLKIKATSPQGLQLPETTVTAGADGTIVLQPTLASNNLPDSIQFYNASGKGGETAFTIDWEIKIGDAAWRPMGSTKHTVYITMADPITTANADPRETLFNIGCRNAKNLAGDPGAVVTAVYGEFTDRQVYRVVPSTGDRDTIKMKYWGDKNAQYFLTKDLLEHGDGKCGAWTRFFTDVLRAQGINSQVMDIQPPDFVWNDLHADLANKWQVGYAIDLPDAGGYKRLFVKNWAPIVDDLVPVDQAGIAAQGNDDPHSRFVNHALVFYDNKLYDPSYGTNPFMDLKSWEDASISFFGGQFTVRGYLNGQNAPSVVTYEWVWKLNTMNSQDTQSLNVQY